MAGLITTISERLIMAAGELRPAAEIVAINHQRDLMGAAAPGV
ncbi:MAG: hypothetical protein ACR2PG_17140 [Hyphomicrobiaceae bacterium]